MGASHQAIDIEKKFAVSAVIFSLKSIVAKSSPTQSTATGRDCILYTMSRKWSNRKLIYFPFARLLALALSQWPFY